MFIQNDPQQPIAIQQKFTKYHNNPQRLQKIHNDLELSKTILNDTKKTFESNAKIPKAFNIT